MKSDFKCNASKKDQKKPKSLSCLVRSLKDLTSPSNVEKLIEDHDEQETYFSKDKAERIRKSISKYQKKFKFKIKPTYLVNIPQLLLMKESSTSKHSNLDPDYCRVMFCPFHKIQDVSYKSN